MSAITFSRQYDVGSRTRALLSIEKISFSLSSSSYKVTITTAFKTCLVLSVEGGDDDETFNTKNNQS